MHKGSMKWELCISATLPLSIVSSRLLFYKQNHSKHSFLSFFFFLAPVIIFVYLATLHSLWGFPGGTSGKEPACQFRRAMGSIPGLEHSPGGGRGIPLQYSCLENPMDRGACRATVHGVAKSQT